MAVSNFSLKIDNEAPATLTIEHRVTTGDHVLGKADLYEVVNVSLECLRSIFVTQNAEPENNTAVGYDASCF